MAGVASELSPDDLFQHDPAGLAICDEIRRAVVCLGDVEERVSTSQVAFRRGRAFALVWRPGRYVDSDVPAVLSIALPMELHSARFKQVVHPSPRTWMHHLELQSVEDVDGQVRAWLAEAWAAAGQAS